MAGKTLTNPSGPVVCSEKTLRALLAIRKEKLLGELFGQVVLARSHFTGLGLEPPLPPWLVVVNDPPPVELPPRLVTATASEALTLRLALAIPASLVLIEGPIKERAKLSFIKCEGTLSLLVSAYREGKLSAVKPMVIALEKLGHGDVLPEPRLLEALWKALDGMAT